MLRPNRIHIACRREYPCGRVIQLPSRAKEGATRDEHLAAKEESGRVANASRAHAAGSHKRACCRVVQFGTLARSSTAPGNEDFAVGQQRRRMEIPRASHAPCGGKEARAGIV